MSDWLIRYWRRSAASLYGMLPWLPIVAGIIVALFTGGSLAERWGLNAESESSTPGLSVLAAVVAAIAAGLASWAFFFGFIFFLAFITDYLAEHSG